MFPYRLYGVGKPDLGLARDTFAARLYPFAKCWGQDGMESALLGLTDEGKEVQSVEEFTSYGNQRFRWFWSKNSDWIPDMDNGGARDDDAPTHAHAMRRQTDPASAGMAGGLDGGFQIARAVSDDG